PVGVIDFTIISNHVFTGASVLGDVNFFGAPQRLNMFRSPIKYFGTYRKASNGRLSVTTGEGNLPPAGRFVGGYHIIRDVNVNANKVQGAADNLQILIREFRRILAGFF